MPIARTRQDRTADVAVLPEVDPGLRNRVRSRLVENVRFVGIVERDVGDPVAFFVFDGQIALPSPVRRSGTARQSERCSRYAESSRMLPSNPPSLPRMQIAGRLSP